MISVQLTETDYIASQRLHAQPMTRFLTIVLALTIPLLCLGVAAWLGAFTEELRTPGFLLVVWLLVSSGTTLALRIFWQPVRWRRLYASHKLLQGTATYSWDEDRFMAKGEYGSSSIPWSKFLKFKENQNMFLLYVSRLQFFLIPKRVFSSESARDDFSALLRAKLSA
jgi:YcxB-like protein